MIVIEMVLSTIGLAEAEIMVSLLCVYMGACKKCQYCPGACTSESIVTDSGHLEINDWFIH